MHLFKRSAVAMLLVASVITSCSKDDNDGGTPPPPPTPATTVKITNNATFGAVMTDSTGRTLYFYSNDGADTSTCTGGCVDLWPIFYVDTLQLTIDPSLKKSDFKTIERRGGAKQTTYKGWPLYYFKNDAAAGQTAGDNVGGIWFVAKPDYSVMISNFQLIGNDGKQYTLKDTIALGTGASKYLVDDRGLTLYKFANDKRDTSIYTNNDAAHNAVWPIYSVETVANVPTGFNKADFKVITTLGNKQLVYKGWPMYYFGNDNKVRGANKGVSVPKINIWPTFFTTTVAAPPRS